MTLEHILCPECNRAHPFDGDLSFREECDSCSHDLHVCITCRFFDRYVENQCRENTAEPVAQKDRRNLCEYWRPLSEKKDDHLASETARSKLDALFVGRNKETEAAPALPDVAANKEVLAKGATEPSSVDDARAKLDALFKK